MARVFHVTAAASSLALDANGEGAVSYTVTNKVDHPLRARAILVPLGDTQASWLSAEGDEERPLGPGATDQFKVKFAAPPGTPAGSYGFRLDAVSVENPDEDFAEGPEITAEVKPSAAPGKPFPWWILAVAAGVLVLGGLIYWLASRGGGGAVEASCAAHKQKKASAASGKYRVDPDADGPLEAFQVYCDMEDDGGGWTLVAKINVSDKKGLAEPRDFFTAGANADQLLDPRMRRNESPAGLGAAKAAAMIASGRSLARFTLIAEAEGSVRRSWYKRVEKDNLEKWFAASEARPTQQCVDAAMTLKCRPARFTDSPDLYWLGMSLSDHGFEARCDLHLRMDGHAASENGSVCSCTFDLNDNAWPDKAFDGHWGNGLLVWVR